MLGSIWVSFSHKDADFTPWIHRTYMQLHTRVCVRVCVCVCVCVYVCVWRVEWDIIAVYKTLNFLLDNHDKCEELSPHIYNRYVPWIGD